MSAFLVRYIDDAGGVVERFIKAWHAAAAERSVAITFGGSFHTAIEVQS